ncbi:hypothetical protein SSYRP_v1c02730 [Spiroplasma syrphidicola EA-1]|uniref:HNH domain-containing protein n=1 Tax=Spiroplasma syrphidicola EA-1 TaxID=1276229 RepID=R4UD79_9MOLU|nr:hypothetical protein [Spiroplasma syrphidicola]AGM25869.1 hypothetical protein SSYRP_v1c02730 [Spiroplasma syrphidicola EA-1]
MSSKSKNRRENEWQSAWLNTDNCNCPDKESHSKDLHKICSICKGIMHKDVRINLNSNLLHHFAWNKDNSKPKANGGTNRKDNLVAMHPWCNQEKIQFSFWKINIIL